MFADDNLYQIVVPDSAKRQSLAAYQKRISERGCTSSVVTPDNARDVKSARHGIPLFLHHLWQRQVVLTILDIGSFVGSFSLGVANCARTFGVHAPVIALDPTEAGVLMKYSIELNGLADWVRHEELAIGETDGLVLFDCRVGHLDSCRVSVERERTVGEVGRSVRKDFKRLVPWPFEAIGWRVQAAFRGREYRRRECGPQAYNLVARSNKIQTYLERTKIASDLFVKIDAEGCDVGIVRQLIALLPERRIWIIFEFAPAQFADDNLACDLLREVSGRYYVFDLFYSSNPTRFRLVQPEQFPMFAKEVREERRYGYTDLFLLDRRTPDCADLIRRLSSLRELPDVYWLAWPRESAGL